MRRKRFIPKDWVYTPSGYLQGVFSQTASPSTALGQPLCYSVNAQRMSGFGLSFAAPPVGSWVGKWASPDVQDQVVYAVDGHIVFNPSAWALGNDFIWGWRLLIAKMDPQDASIIPPGGTYSMWTAAPPDDHYAAWRNSQDVLAEDRIYRAFGENTSNGAWRIPVRWSRSQGRRLEADEALFLWIEGASASVNTSRNRMHVRTLMKKPR